MLGDALVFNFCKLLHYLLFTNANAHQVNDANPRNAYVALAGPMPAYYDDSTAPASLLDALNILQRKLKSVKQDAVKTERETQEKMAKMEERERQMRGELSKLRDRVELVESENLKKDAKITTMTQNIEEMELQL
jgi:hypothetical protein